MMVEAIGSDGRRCFRSWTAASIAGSWTPLAASEGNPFARANNTTFPSGAWTKDISHGEMIRHHRWRAEVDRAVPAPMGGSGPWR
ncbi:MULTISPECIES: non-reducing end alpha-L-arabinofuranosidase family hydrolase [Streptomyces violaceusniger group]|uniref:non-reducing end alpha-L-arabinofuranosidase n=2 Tax=Streptomyces rhizosphaericus TaxID=114699 RepID=A0ABN1RY28_9ACTN